MVLWCTSTMVHWLMVQLYIPLYHCTIIPLYNYIMQCTIPSLYLHIFNISVLQWFPLFYDFYMKKLPTLHNNLLNYAMCCENHLLLIHVQKSKLVIILYNNIIIRDEPIKFFAFFSPIFLSSNSFFNVLCTILCSSLAT